MSFLSITDGKGFLEVPECLLVGGVYLFALEGAIDSSVMKGVGQRLSAGVHFFASRVTKYIKASEGYEERLV